ncbi:MAG: hydrogenase nickel incorporation protein HypA [Candidatus Thermoplasmatota archaeon]
MHEWALAESVIFSLLKYAKQHHIRSIKEIVVGVGELQQIDTEIVRFAFDEIKKDHDVTRKAVIKFNVESSQFHCLRCGHKWLYSEVKEGVDVDDAESIHFIPEVYLVHMRCPRCNNPDFEIIKGRGLTIQTIRGIVDDKH